MEYKNLNEINASDFSLDILQSENPVVIRGIVSDWPIVKKSTDTIKRFVNIFYIFMKVTELLPLPANQKRVTSLHTATIKIK